MVWLFTNILLPLADVFRGFRLEETEKFFLQVQAFEESLQTFLVDKMISAISPYRW